MIIVIDVNGKIYLNAKDISIDCTDTDAALNWTIDQIKDQRGASNIVIDMRDCPFLKKGGKTK